MRKWGAKYTWAAVNIPGQPAKVKICVGNTD